jgi:DNA-directed RNA polymerase subunit beta'
LHDVYDPVSDELIVEAGAEITENIAQKIEDSPILEVEIRSVLTCEARRGVCEKCYGRNLSTGRMVKRGESVGVIAAQSIGEPGTQLTLRTFHVGGVASQIASESQIVAKFDGKLEFENVETVEREINDEIKHIVISRAGEVRIVEPEKKIVLATNNIPYGSILEVKGKRTIKKDQLIAAWDPYNAVILANGPGKIEYLNIIENVTYREESDEQTGHKEKVITETRDKKKIPTIRLVDETGSTIKEYNLPVGAHIVVENGNDVKIGETLAKIPRMMSKTKDITGGLPRVTELFEARNPSNPAVITEIDGIISFGGIKRGNREIIVESKEGERKKYLVPLSKHILVQENDYVKAGDNLSDGAMSPIDILSIKGPYAVQQYIIDGIQEVYRLQGVKINDKHIEVIVRQMMQKVEIVNPGDTRFLEGTPVDKFDVIEENNWIFDKMVVVDSGETNDLKPGPIISSRKLREINSQLKRRDMALVQAREAVPATVKSMLQGITRASLGTKSFLSAASFQETTKVLNEAAITGKTDYLKGLKENVIVGHRIPAGTGIRDFEKNLVGSKDEYEELLEATK